MLGTTIPGGLRRWLALVRLVHRRALFSCIVFAVLVLLLVPLTLLLRSRTAARTAGYSSSTFDYQVSGPIGARAVSALRDLAEPGSLALFVTIGGVVLEANGKALPGVSLYASRDGRFEQSWFTDDVTLERANPSGRWVDISASVADALDVSAGGHVSFSVADDATQTLKVRRVLNVDLKGVRGVATGRADALRLPEVIDRQPATSALFKTDLQRRELEEVLTRVMPAGFDLVARRDALAHLERSEGSHGKRLLVTTVIVFVGIALLGAREGALTALDHRRALLALLVLGVRRLRMLASIVALHAVLLGVVAVVGTPLARVLVYPLLSGVPLSGSMAGDALALVTIAAAVYLALLASMLIVVTRRHPLLRATTDGRTA